MRRVGDAEMRAALAAGWRRGDLWWERWQERANVAWEQGHRGRARADFALAALIARILFASSDPRRATSLANLALVARARGAESLAARRYEKALALWARVPETLGRLTIRPRSRSSLFHLRMELRHREAFRQNAERRLAAFVAESGACLDALAAGRVPPHRLHARWRGVKPPVFDDARKLLGACLLLAGDAGPHGRSR